MRPRSCFSTQTAARRNFAGRSESGAPTWRSDTGGSRRPRGWRFSRTPRAGSVAFIGPAIWDDFFQTEQFSSSVAATSQVKLRGSPDRARRDRSGARPGTRPVRRGRGRGRARTAPGDQRLVAYLVRNGGKCRFQQRGPPRPSSARPLPALHGPDGVRAASRRCRSRPAARSTASALPPPGAAPAAV